MFSDIQIRKPKTLISAFDKLEPFLIYKKPKLLLAREFAVSLIKYRNKHRTPEILKERKELYDRWKLL